jgi:hypothetical protein
VITGSNVGHPIQSCRSVRLAVRFPYYTCQSTILCLNCRLNPAPGTASTNTWHCFECGCLETGEPIRTEEEEDPVKRLTSRGTKRYIGMVSGVVLLCLFQPAFAEAPTEPAQIYDSLKNLEGKWSLSAADIQEGGTKTHPSVLHLLGSDQVVRRTCCRERRGRW